MSLSKGNVIPLDVEGASGVKEQRLPQPRGSRLHGASVIGMALCALLGIVTMLAFITISWPGEMSRILVGVFVFSVIGFMASASMAVLAAARDTYYGGAKREIRSREVRPG